VDTIRRVITKATAATTGNTTPPATAAVDGVLGPGQVDIKEPDMKITTWLALSLSLTAFSASAQTFGGNDCTDDCSGHKAGYEWALENNLTN
jgi:hypothetical protein